MPKISVIGCGHWGKNLVRNFSELGALYAVCDANKDQADAFAQQYNVLSQTIDETLADENVDGVVIAAPAALHAEIALKAFDANKHVYVEKPIALNIQDAKDVIAQGQTKNKTLMTGHLLQYHPAYVTLKNMVMGGDLGALCYVYCNRLNLGKIRQEEDVFLSFAPHDISMILGLTGALPQTVHGFGSYHLCSDIADMAHVRMAFEGGINATVFVSWLHPTKEQRLVVVGEKGMAVFDDLQPWENKLMLYKHGAAITPDGPVIDKAEGTPVPLAEGEPLKAECQHFLDCITSGNTPITGPEESLNVLTVMDAAQKSILQNETVSLFADDTPRPHAVGEA